MMNPRHDDSQIPTLTDIIQPGDASMKNHFDSRYFDDDNGLDDETEPRKPSVSAEAAEQPADELRDTIEILVQQALDETMPVIEDQLRQQLTRKVLEKLADDDRL